MFSNQEDNLIYWLHLYMRKCLSNRTFCNKYFGVLLNFLNSLFKAIMNKMSEFSQELSCECADKSNVNVLIFINLWCPLHYTG